MIVRRYGGTIHSVTPDFDPHAMSEIGFRRDGRFSMPADEFESSFERVAGHELRAESEGDVHAEAERQLLERLRARLDEVHEQAPENGLLLVENRPGTDHAKTRSVQTTRVVGFENRFYFEFSVDPPLRVGLYRRRGD